jgi:hypothetical protein
MTKFLTFRCLAAMFLLLAAMQTSLAQAAFWQETFSNQATATTQWVHGGTNAGATPQTWTWTDDPGAGFQFNNLVPPFGAVTASTGYFFFNSDANGPGMHDMTLTGVGNPANCTGKANVNLRFTAQYAYFDSASVQVGVSTDGQNFTYQTVLSSVSSGTIFQGPVTLDLNAADNAAQVWLQFRWIGDFEYHLKIDDVELFDVPVGPVPCDQNPFSIICDNFESYNTGNISPQSTHWIPWDLVEASAVGAEVSTEFASQGTKSMKCKLQGNGDDQLLQLGNRTTGNYNLKWKMYIPAAKAAYINVQTDESAPGATNANFSYQLYFRTDKSIVQDIPLPADTIANAFPQGQWFQFEGKFDLDNNSASIYLNGNLIRTFFYPQDLGAIDFYCADATYLFYIDEVEFVQVPSVLPDECPVAFDITALFGGVDGLARQSGLFDNTNATVATGEPVPACFGDFANGSTQAPKLDKTLWFTFTGDGDKYHIETVPCNAVSYIGSAQNDIGDTQMAIYTGACGALTQVACADDLFPMGEIDWRAGLDLQTTAGTAYRMQIDGFNAGGTVATGEFCIEVVRGDAVSCLEGQMGTYEVSSQYLCFGDNINSIITLNNDFVLPTSGIGGMAWAVSTGEIASDEWPVDNATYLGSTGVLLQPFVLGLPNTGGFQPGIYYMTPVVLGNGLDLNGSTEGAAALEEIDPTNACFAVGQSIPFAILPALDDLFATFSVENVTGPGNNGSITLSPEGGFPGFISDPSAYIYNWSNGATTQNLTGIAAGTYSVEIADPSGCVEPITLTIGVTSPTNDPKSVQVFSLTPNPTTGLVQLNLQLNGTEPVNCLVTNTLGQTVITADAGKVNAFTQTLDFSGLPTGTYFLHVTIGKETAVRKVVVQR